MINSFLLFFPKKPRVRLESEDGMSPNVGIPSPEGHVYVFILVINIKILVSAVVTNAEC
ncbi:hypothetical protein HanXRQr2_Chr15g0716931 [Helianthus annuus]|uniref:Uncharacterized protein n=1 Tax=Helianthus annuus TaxID=4232 RepID=A0A251SG71_HELAN|nr:hypothetical protein HanXRQr2_Chr15g0716931 [Helianthus annuus]KAJ0833227.1 hypothetical protein HanPSC8_Chr15g0687901 [Helianthus annuus]